jgi:hypothetical protein
MTERQAHIIQSSNGRVYDLTALETPFGLLPEDVQKALKDWPHGWTEFLGSEWHIKTSLAWARYYTYRAKPAPEVKEYVLYWCPGYNATKSSDDFDTHRITIRDDGTGQLTAEVEALK